MDAPGHTLPSLRRWAIAGPIILALLVGAILAWANPDTGEMLGGLGIVIGDVTAGILILRHSRGLDQRERVAWRFLAAGLFLVASGVLAVGILTELGHLVPAFGQLDLSFLAG